MATKLYLIKNISNLHVGSGDTNYGVIDNLVQKDVNTGLPTIHSSSLKGAFREHFKHHADALIEPVFGNEDNKPGKWKFLSAQLLSRPVRSDKTPYLNATSPETVKQFIAKAEDLGYEHLIDELEQLSAINPANNSPLVFDQAMEGSKIEETDWEAQYNEMNISDDLKKLFGENIVLVNHEDFIQLDLPVIARNHLENGKSQNLWYEEVVPYDSRFAFFIITDDNNENKFNQVVDNKIVQIGANASIGYGLCKINEIKNESL